jgi:hypothetical protein
VAIAPTIEKGQFTGAFLRFWGNAFFDGDARSLFICFYAYISDIWIKANKYLFKTLS